MLSVRAREAADMGVGRGAVPLPLPPPGFSYMVQIRIVERG